MKCFFDHKTTGHHIEYIDHLLSSRHSDEALFLLNSKLRNRFGARSNVIYRHFDEEKSLFEHFSVLKQFVSDYSNVNHIVLLELDCWQYELLKWKNESKIIISGIYFSPPLRVLNRNSYFLLLKSKLRRFRKLLQVRLLLRRVNFKYIYILNDQEQVDSLNKKLKTSTFKQLADPVFIVENQVGSTELKHNSFLIFGTIDSRKNIINLIKGINELKKACTLSIVGKSNSAEYEQEIKRVSSESIHVKVIRINSFVNNHELISFIRNSAIILATYIDFYGSSGVVNHAVKYKKPVLVSNYGLMKYLVTTYELGLTCDPNNIKDITIKLSYLLNYHQSYKANEYLKNNSIEGFTERLLNES